MTTKLLLCTDMDRTLLPNGDAPLSSAATPLFQQLVNHPSIILVYVTGRDLGLVQQAIAEYQMPKPDYVITDVGASIYQRQHDQFQEMHDWQTFIGQDWLDYDSTLLGQALGKFQAIEQQAASRQGRYKLSYQVTPSAAMAPDLECLNQRLNRLPIQTSVIASVDETLDQGLIDVLPARANKRTAIDYLVNYLALPSTQVFFSGDSGNDMAVLASPYYTTLVANATPDVRAQARALAQSQGAESTLYLAQGMPQWKLNGNYCAGILEGFLHFFPHAQHWLKMELKNEY